MLDATPPEQYAPSLSTSRSPWLVKIIVAVSPKCNLDMVSQLDGNVSRLISRLLAIHAPPKSKASLDLLWQGAQVMVEGATCAGDVNQALIELGSTVCKPRDPDCSGCPLQRWCHAYQIAEKVSIIQLGQCLSWYIDFSSRARREILKTSAPSVIRYQSQMASMHHQ